MLNPAFHAWSYYCLPLGRRVCGGLRNSATITAVHRSKRAVARGVGADSGNGLAVAQWQHAGLCEQVRVN